MTSLEKSSILAIISFLVVLGFSVPATTYAWGGDSFFFPTSGYSGPREQLVVYAFGPSSAPSYNTMQVGTYQPAYHAGGSQYPAQYSYQQPSYAMPQNYAAQNSSFENYGRFRSKFFTYTPVNVNNYTAAHPSYSQPSYQQYSNSYPHYSSNSYPSYGGSYGSGGGYAQSTGTVDFWGNQLCNWGDGYAGYPCDRDPHQWIHDPYTGTWY